MNSSEKESDLLTACFFRLRTENDHPYRMDYQRCCHPLAILYPLRPKGIRGYFSQDVADSVDISIDLPPICSTIESTFHTLAAEDVFLAAGFAANWQRITVKEAGLARVGFFGEQNANAH